MLLGAVLVTYGRVFAAGFVAFDDDFQVYANPFLNPPTLESVGRFWQHAYQQLYIPLAYTILAGLARIAGVPAHLDASLGQTISLDPAPFHVAGVALHALNVWLCFGLVRRLTGRPRVAWICSLVFALHPLQVESVAWVSELRGLTSSALVLLALNLFVASRRNADRARSIRLLVGVALSGAAAVSCKPGAAVLPLAALAIDRAVLGTPWRRALGAASLVAAAALPFVLATRAVQEIPAGAQSLPWQRPFVAGDALAFYLFKSLLPLDLCVDYGRTPQSVMSHARAYLVWAIPVVLLVLAFRHRARRPVTWLGAALAGAFLLPTSGLVPFAYQAYSTVADRYMYLALIGLGLVAADGLERVQSRKVVAVGAAAALAALAALTFGQSRHWRSSPEFLRHTIDVNPAAGFAYNNLGDIELANGDVGRALSDYQACVGVDPTRVKAHINLAEVYTAMNRPDQAESAVTRAMSLPNLTSDDLSNLGIVLMKMNQPARALPVLARAVSLDPSSPIYLFNQANALAAVGQFEQAEAVFRRCIAVAPTLVGAHTGLGIVLAQTGRLPDAAAEFRTALRLQPNDPAALDDLRRAEELLRR